MARSDPLRVGFIGLGTRAPHGSPDPRGRLPADAVGSATQSLEPFDDTAATAASTPAALAEASSIVCICVTGDEDVLEVANGPEGVLSGLAAGGTLIVHSTVHPETCIRLHLMGKEKGITVLDAPVSGGGPAATQGTLLVMVGGDEAGLDRARPVLATFGDPILHLGDVGAGRRPSS